MANDTKYYAWKLYNAQGTSGEIKSVHRIVRDSGNVRMERYDPDPGKWVHNPGLIQVTGMGGDHNYEEISRAEAVDFLKGKIKSPEAAAQI